MEPQGYRRMFIVLGYPAYIATLTSWCFSVSEHGSPAWDYVVSCAAPKQQLKSPFSLSEVSRANGAGDLCSVVKAGVSPLT